MRKSETKFTGVESQVGLELKTTAVIGKEKASGKLHLDSSKLSFSSKELKWSVDLGPTVRAVAKGSQLIVSKGREKSSFEIGDDGEKWVRKILNPPSRLDKLGVKPGMVCWLSKGFGRDFINELKSRETAVTRKPEKCDLAFLSIVEREELGDLIELLQQLPDRINIWVVWPKANPKAKNESFVTQTDVMTTAKQNGFGPSKTAAFDDTRSSMRFARKS